MYKIYLAGPITGLSFDDCSDWREQAIMILTGRGMQGISPLRAKEYLKNYTTIEDGLDLEDTVLSSQRGIYFRDKFDCERADLVIVNFLGAKKVSIGSVMEIAWATTKNTPIVLIMEEKGNVHDYSLINEACPFRVTSLSEAIRITETILAPQN